MKLRGGLGNRGRGSLLLISIVSASLIVAASSLSWADSASGGDSDTSAFTGACKKLPSPSAPDFTNRFNQFVMHLCYQKQNWKHDANRRTSQNIHDTLVKIWYSPLLFKWMTVLNRQPSAILFHCRWRTHLRDTWRRNSGSAVCPWSLPARTAADHRRRTAFLLEDSQ